MGLMGDIVEKLKLGDARIGAKGLDMFHVKFRTEV